MDVFRGEPDSASVCAENVVFVTLPRLRGEIKTEIIIPDTVCAPVCEGDKIGSVKFYLDGKYLAETNLIAENASGEARGGKGIWFWKK
ncbi:MAG: hypothetical protein KBS59_00150 [Clostridiales bacterium]|nr:hypothetical protein [Clostridiales bacterium]